MSRPGNKNAPWEYREAVYKKVQEVMKFTGQYPTGPDAFIGDWVCTINPNSGDDVKPAYYQSFNQDGTAPTKAINGSWESSNDKWKYNQNNTLNLSKFVGSTQQFGMGQQPTYSEINYLALIKSPDELVLFNGDGTLILLFTRLES